MKSIMMAVVAMFVANAASAATLRLELDGLVAGNKVLGRSFDLDQQGRRGNQAGGWSAAGYEAFAPSGVGHRGDAVTEIGGGYKTSARGLFLDGPARVTFTYLGEEAGYTNSFSVLGGSRTLFTNNGVSTFGDSVTMLMNGGMLDFAFSSSGWRSGSVANNGGVSQFGRSNIAYSALFNDSRSALVFFGDGGGGRDNDDLAVRIDVAAVPLPAAAWMLLAGAGALAVMGRKRARRG